MNSFMRALLFAIIGAVPLVFLYFALMSANIYPLLSGSICFDDKAYFIHSVGLEPEDVDVMGLGSSVTLNNLHSEAMEDYLGDEYQFFNFASWGLKMKNNLDMIDLYLDRYDPKVIVTVSSPVDFKGDAVPIATQWETEMYIQGFFSYFYLGNPSIQELIARNTWRKQISTDRSTLRSLKFDSSGGVDLVNPNEKEILDRYEMEKVIDAATEEHFNSLVDLAKKLDEKGVKLVFVDTYIRDTDCEDEACQEKMRAHARRVEKILNQYDHYYVNLHEASKACPDTIFFDEFHLKDGGAERLTKAFLDQVDLKEVLGKEKHVANVK